MSTKQIAVTTPSEPLLVPVKEAARRLGVSPWEIRRLVRKGHLACKRLSKTNWLISTKSIRQFADSATNGVAA